MFARLIFALVVLAFGTVEANALNRFWVGSTGTWDGSSTAHWAATSGGGSGATVPGSGDTVTFDNLSGGGTVTVNTTVTVAAITMGAFTGTLDFSANNNNVTTPSFNNSNTGTRTLNMGTGTWTLGPNANPLVTNASGLTLTPTAANIIIVGNGSSTSNIGLGTGLSYGNFTLNANASGGGVLFLGASTISSLTITGPNTVWVTQAQTLTVTNGVTCNGSLSNPILVSSSTDSAVGTVSSANASTATVCGFVWMTFSGGGTMTGTGFDFGHNTGVTVTAPSAGTGGGGIIGG
jgi:hypothetical protein